MRLATLPRKEGEELRIDLDTYNGFQYVSVRLWWRDGSAQWRPGQKGLSIKIRELAAVWDALAKAVNLTAVSDGQKVGSP